MWRPNNWKKFEVENHPLHCLAPDACLNVAYEAGADAMLEALWKLLIEKSMSRLLANETWVRIPLD